MRKYCTIPVSIPTVIDGPVDVFEWTSADPFPVLGDSVGVDTETELITDSCLYPPLVVLGVFDGASRTCYICDHASAPEFMRQLCLRDVEQRFFNLGFDEGVLDNEDPDKPLLRAIDAGRVIDMQIRAHLSQLAAVGFIRQSTHSLAGCCSLFLKVHLDKGDGTESSARMSFHRGVPITEEQARYLPMDCITTWALGEKLKGGYIPRNVEVAHTKGMCVLSHISANGFLVDPEVFGYYLDKLTRQREVHKQQLLEYGFPDPDREPESMQDAGERLQSALEALTGGRSEADMPGKQALRLMLIYMWNHDGEKDEAEDLRRDVLAVSSATRSPGKAERALYDEMLDDLPIAAFDECRMRMAFPVFVACVLEALARQDCANGYDVRAAMEEAADEMDAHPEYTMKVKPVGPKKFFQDHVIGLIMEEFPGGRREAEQWLDRWRQANPGRDLTAELKAMMACSRLKLETTKKSGSVQLTLKDKWRLRDLGIQDGFLDAYTAYGHCTKYISTYLNKDYVKSDGRVHPRYISVLKTGRTSCTSPNV